MGCEEVQRLLEERAVACRGEVERLRIEAERIAELIGAREAELLRLDTARQVVGELPAAHVVATSNGGVPAQRPGPGTAGAVTARAAKTEEFTAKVRHVVEAFAVNDGTAVRCKDVVEALGEEVVPRRVEKVRHHLKRLVVAGALAEVGPGLFTPAGGAAVARE
jgi:hypothetical protein